MLTTLKNAFKIKDVRSRILFTFVMLIVVRLGAAIPTPGVNSEVFRRLVCKSNCKHRRCSGFF